MEVESQTSCYYAQYVLIHIYTFLETEACIKICLWRQNWFWNIPRCGPWGLMACIVHIFLSPVRMTILSNARSLFWQLCDGVCGICQTSVGWGFMFNPKTGFLSRKKIKPYNLLQSSKCLRWIKIFFTLDFKVEAQTLLNGKYFFKLSVWRLMHIFIFSGMVMNYIFEFYTMGVSVV